MSYPIATTQAPLTPGYQAGYYQQTMPAYPQAPAHPQHPVYRADYYQPTYQQPAYQQPYAYPQAPTGYQQQAASLAGLGTLIAGIVGLFKRPKSQAQAPVQAPNPYANVNVPDRSQVSDEAFVVDLYRRLLGREPDPQGFQSHVNGLRRGLDRSELLRIFIESPEYRQRQVAGPAALPTGPVAFQIPQQLPVAQPVPPAAPSAPLEGFDFNKLNNPNHRTPKYLFARVVQHVPLTSVRDHASAEALLRAIRPQLEAAGLRILDVKNDKIHVITEIGAEWVDVIRGSGAPNPAWWWGSEGVGTPVPGMQAPQPGPAPQLPGNSLPSLQTVPVKPEFGAVPVDKSSANAAILSVATWVKQNFPGPFQTDDRAQHYQAMTMVIGILRAHGFDAHRVVNHESRAVGDPWRYGSDALVLNGSVYDVYQGIGDPNMSRPQAMNVGPYAAGRLRE